jgi:hypothetical protein
VELMLPASATARDARGLGRKRPESNPKSICHPSQRAHSGVDSPLLQALPALVIDVGGGGGLLLGESGSLASGTHTLAQFALDGAGRRAPRHPREGLGVTACSPP